MAACGFDHHRAMASGSSPSPGPTRCPSESRPATPPGPGCSGLPWSGSTRPRTSATSCTASRCFPRSFLSPTRTPTSAPSPTRSRAWSGTTSPPSPTTTTPTSSIRWPARRRISTGRGRRSRSRSGPSLFSAGRTTCSSTAASPRARRTRGSSATCRPATSRRRSSAGEALQWLSRDLDEAMIAFIKSARSGDAIRGCFYEFTYRAGAGGAGQGNHRRRRRAARGRLQSQRAHQNEKQPDGTAKAVFYESDPRLRNLAAIADAGLPASAIIRREARRSDLTHNKFMVLLDRAISEPGSRSGPAPPTSPKVGSTARPTPATGSGTRGPLPGSASTGSCSPPIQEGGRVIASRRSGRGTKSSTTAWTLSPRPRPQTRSPPGSRPSSARAPARPRSSCMCRCWTRRRTWAASPSRSRSRTRSRPPSPTTPAADRCSFCCWRRRIEPESEGDQTLRSAGCRQQRLPGLGIGTADHPWPVGGRD